MTLLHLGTQAVKKKKKKKEKITKIEKSELEIGAYFNLIQSGSRMSFYQFELFTGGKILSFIKIKVTLLVS